MIPIMNKTKIKTDFMSSLSSEIKKLKKLAVKMNKNDWMILNKGLFT